MSAAPRRQVLLRCGQIFVATQSMVSSGPATSLMPIQCDLSFDRSSAARALLFVRAGTRSLSRGSIKDDLPTSTELSSIACPLQNLPRPKGTAVNG